MSALAPTASLVDLETVIERGMATFVEVGEALLAIQDGKMYQPAYRTFPEYCRARWSMEKSRAYQLMAAAATMRQLETQNVTKVDDSSTIVDTPVPQSESQVRPLSLIKGGKEKAEAWGEAVEAAGGKQPTAAQVKAAVDKRQPPKLVDASSLPKKKAEPKPKSEELLSVERAKKALDDKLWAIFGDFTGYLSQVREGVSLLAAMDTKEIAAMFEAPGFEVKRQEWVDAAKEAQESIKVLSPWLTQFLKATK